VEVVRGLSPTSAVSLARTLIRADTVNPPGNEDVLARLLAARLSAAGLVVTTHELSPGRVGVVARAPSATQRPALCLTGHLDVVPVGENPWLHDPFGAHIDGDRLYGRGSSDMKGGVAAIVGAIEQFGGRWDNAEAGVEVVFTCGEETGCDGAKALAASGLLGEVGAVLVAEPTANQPRIAHKGVLWLLAEATGEAAHGSAPERGRNAILPLANAVADLDGMDFGVPEHALLGGPTVNVGTISGGVNVNSVPDRAVAELDVRLVPGLDPDRALAMLRERMGPAVELTPTLSLPAVATSADDPWVQQVLDVLEPLHGHRPEPAGISPFTDAAVLTPAYGGPPTIVCGPGEPDQAHRTDEWCSIRRIEQAVEAYAEIIRRWCGL
jgi:succinyl-diaminopimelate desuccinylase